MNNLDKIIEYFSSISDFNLPITLNVDDYSIEGLEYEDIKNALHSAIKGFYDENKTEQLVKKAKIKFETCIIKSISELTENDLYKPICLDAMIIEKDKEKIYLQEGLYIDEEFHKNLVSIDKENEFIPQTIKCQKCRKTMSFQTKGSVFGNVLNLTLQEWTTLKADSQRTLDSKIYDSNIYNDVILGQKCRFFGMIRPKTTKSFERDFVFEIWSIDITSDEKTELPNQAEMKYLETLSKKPEFFDNIIDSFCPQVKGENDLKISILLALINGNTKDDIKIGDTVLKRGLIHVLMLGDPGTSKSTLMEYAFSLSPKSMYKGGGGVSGVGLTVGLVKKTKDQMVAAIGVLPLCNKGVAYIDEIEKMNTDDRSRIHICMEQLMCYYNKGGFNLAIPTETTIIAAGNPKFGKWLTNDKTVLDNIDLPVSFLSRCFSWLVLDKRNENEDREIAKHILKQYQTKPKAIINKEMLIRYINYAKSLTPEFTKVSQDELVEQYVSIRKMSNEDSIPIHARQLQDMARLSIAYAKARLKKSVDREDIIFACNLFRRSLESFGMKSNIDQSTLFKNSKINQEQMILDTINNCLDENKTFVERELIDKLVGKGFPMIKALQAIQKYKNAGKLLEQKNGRYMLI